jgi:hypothetical protein
MQMHLKLVITVFSLPYMFDAAWYTEFFKSMSQYLVSVSLHMRIISELNVFLNP